MPPNINFPALYELIPEMHKKIKKKALVKHYTPETIKEFKMQQKERRINKYTFSRAHYALKKIKAQIYHNPLGK